MEGSYFQESLRLLVIARSGYAESMRGLKEPRSILEAIAILSYLRDEARNISARAANLADLLRLELDAAQKGGERDCNAKDGT